MLSAFDSQAAIRNVLPDNNAETRSRFRHGRTDSLLINQLMKNTDFDGVSDDAPPEELLEKAVQNAVNNEVDEVKRDLAQQHNNVKDTLGEMHEREIHNLRTKLRQLEARNLLTVENLRKDHANEIKELHKNFQKESVPQIRALHAEQEEMKAAWEEEREQLEDTIEKLNEQSSKEFLALKAEKMDLEMQISRLQAAAAKGGSSEAKNLIVVQTNYNNEELSSELEDLRVKLLEADDKAKEAVEEMQRILSESEEARGKLDKLKKHQESDSQMVAMLRMQVSQLEAKLEEKHKEETRIKSEHTERVSTLENSILDLRAQVDVKREHETSLTVTMTEEQIAMLEWKRSTRSNNIEYSHSLSQSHSPHSERSYNGSPEAFDGSPKTFVYGHTNQNSRISVVSDGDNPFPTIRSDDVPLEEETHTVYSPPCERCAERDREEEDIAQAERELEEKELSPEATLVISPAQSTNIKPTRHSPGLSISNFYGMYIDDRVSLELTLEELEATVPYNEYERVNAENNKLMEEISNMRINHDNLMRKTAQAAVDETEKNVSEAEVEKMNVQVASLKRQVEMLNLEVEKLNTTIVELQGSHKQTLDELQIVHQRTLNEMKEIIERLTNDLVESQERLAFVSKDHKAAVVTLQGKIAERDLKISANSNLVFSLSDEINRLRERFFT